MHQTCFDSNQVPESRNLSSSINKQGDGENNPKDEINIEAF